MRSRISTELPDDARVGECFCDGYEVSPHVHERWFFTHAFDGIRQPKPCVHGVIPNDGCDGWCGE